ncbi:MAG: hypothetical protein F6K40_18675 [Okeania sp. SIO3I5]|uniref:hypothetical protein n=1 Tax=Okeania sp. SIO3I5 TaxID=2607805 RepID=UPI0013BAEB72|nr:hypothetical protein [Okeania sp. SIO3I5]NEQ38177.1 hypothetical protein [Okeania sp. SIO3I5]
MSSENLELFETEYKAGKHAFERGQYSKSLQHLETALENINPNSRLGGETQIWLVTAYQAAGKVQEATALCKKLIHHSYLQTRQQAKRILAILEAPVLRTRPEWVTKIPDLGEISESDAKDRRGSGLVSQVKSPPPKPKIPQLEVVDPSKVNTKDNQFVWVALVLIILTLSGLVWLS